MILFRVTFSLDLVYLPSSLCVLVNMDSCMSVAWCVMFLSLTNWLKLVETGNFLSKISVLSDFCSCEFCSMSWFLFIFLNFMSLRGRWLRLYKSEVYKCFVYVLKFVVRYQKKVAWKFAIIGLSGYIDRLRSCLQKIERK